MGATNAQILVGKSHTYDGGLINIHHALYLSENSVARWLLAPVDLYGELRQHGETGQAPSTRRGWIPDPDTMLEDGLLLLGLYVWQDEQLIHMANQVFKKPFHEVDFLNEAAIRTEDRLSLHQLNRQRMQGGKLVITVMAGSTIMHQLDVLRHYNCEMEVCVPFRIPT